MTPGIVLHVRPGFEDDAGRELAYNLEKLGVSGFTLQTEADFGIVTANLDLVNFKKARAALRFRELIFARQLLWVATKVDLPAEGDRASSLVKAIQDLLLPMAGANAFSGFFFETPDADSAKELTGFCKSLSRPIENSLNKLKLLPKGKGAAHLPRIHLIMVSNHEVLVTFADIENANPWPMGIPRLKFPPSAPSRSTLKLEEAFHVFLGEQGMTELLQPGMTAVDLGACPGGWTFQLVKRGIHTIAIDNGAIDSKLMSTGLVTHLREDAFRFRPHHQIDWLVCDVVEMPSRIAALMSEWFIHDHCRHAVFNLKLPMKKRFEETLECLNLISERCQAANKPVKLAAKQLYHDRKEITVYAVSQRALK